MMNTRGQVFLLSFKFTFTHWSMYSTHLHSNLQRSEDMVGGLFTSHTPVGLGAQTQLVRPASELLHLWSHPLGGDVLFFTVGIPFPLDI